MLNERSSASAFIRGFDWTYPSLYEPTGAIRDGLGLIGQPVTLFLNVRRIGRHVDRPLSQEALVGRLETVLRD